MKPHKDAVYEANISIKKSDRFGAIETYSGYHVGLTVAVLLRLFPTSNWPLAVTPITAMSPFEEITGMRLEVRMESMDGGGRRRRDWEQIWVVCRVLAWPYFVRIINRESEINCELFAEAIRILPSGWCDVW